MDNTKSKIVSPTRNSRSSPASYSLLIVVPVFVTILFGLIGWGVVTFDRKDPFLSTVKIVVLTLSSFNLSTDYKSIMEQSNWLVNLSALFGSLTTFAGAIAFVFVFSRERLLRLKAKYIWSQHVVVVGDTLLARRLASWFRLSGHAVVQVVAVEGESSPGATLPIGFDVPDVIRAARPHRARLTIADLETDAATLAFGQGMLLAMNVAREEEAKHLTKAASEPRLALKVEDQVLSDEFLEFTEGYARPPLEETKVTPKIRPIVFDEYRTLARHILANHPLFVLAGERKQRRVHAMIIGANDLADRLLDQIFLTSVGISLDVPTVTVLDRDAARRECEFRARRPAVFEQLPIQFIEFDINTDLSATTSKTAGLSKFFDPEDSSGVTAVYVALTSESESLRAALLLRRYQERTGDLARPIFYYQQPVNTRTSFAPLSSSKQQQMIAMQAPIDRLVSDVLDPDGREDLARALHESYLKGDASQQSAVAWNMLPDALRNANIRAGDQIPALLWSLGIESCKTVPGELPRLDASTLTRLLATLSDPAVAEEISRLEHERWMIERKLDGWSYGEKRDDQKRHHPLLVSWEELKKSPVAVKKDLEQVSTLLRYIGDGSRRT